MPQVRPSKEKKQKKRIPGCHGLDHWTTPSGARRPEGEPLRVWISGCDIMFHVQTTPSAQRPFYLFLSNSMPFISLSCFISLARTSSAAFNRSGHSTRILLFMILKGKSLQSFITKYDATGGVFRDALYREKGNPPSL